MTEKIGLEAILSLGSFSKAVQTYNASISGMSKNTASTASSISSSFVGLGSGILKVGAIAAGAGLAGITALTAGLLLLGSTALTEFARYERSALSVQSLVARELSQGKQVEQQRTVNIGLTKKEAQELDGLAAKIQKEELARNTLHARIKEQSEALRQLREAHGADALDVQTATARLAELENQYNTSGTAIDKLKGRQAELSDTSGRYATIIEKVRTGQMSMTEAMAQAGPRAEELLKWISKLAIQSPFTQQGIQDAFQTALAYGFTTEAAQRLTQAEVDFTSATGKSIEQANLIALALGQMQAKGKVSGQELIQLTNAGIGVNTILEGMGFTLDDVSNGLVSADKFIEAVITDMEIFKGAGAAQAATFSGLISTLGDLKAIGLREFFTGTFTTIQPYLADFVGMLTSAALETGRIRELGDVLGTYVAGGIQKVVAIAGQMRELFGTFQTGGAAGLVAALGITPDAISLFEKFRGMVTQIADTIAGPLMAAFSGLSTGGILDTINQSITFLNDHFVELQGALLGIGAILATGVFAAIAAGIFSIITPFTLLGTAVVLFSTAWAGNWGNIQGIAQQALAVLTTVFNTLSAVALSLANTIMTNVWPPLQETFKNITAALNNMGLTWGDVWNALATATKIVAGTVGVLLLGLIGTIAGLVSGFASAFATITSYLVDLQNSVSQFVSGVTTLFTGLVTITSGLLIGDLGMIFKGVQQSVQGVIDTVGGMGKFILTGLQASLGGVLSFVKGWTRTFTGFFDSLAPVLGEKFEKAWKAIREVWKPEKWFELGESIITGILEGIKKNQAEVLEMLKSLMGDAIQAAKDAIGYGSPAKQFTPLGESIPQGIAKGISDAAPLAQSALNSLMTGLKVTDDSFIHKFVDDVDIGGALRARNVDRNSALGKGISDALKAGLGGFVTNLQRSPELADVTAFVGQIATQWGRSLSSVADKVDIPTLYKEIKAKFDELWGKLRIENLGAALGVAQGFAGIGASFADVVKEQMEGFSKLREESTKLEEENKKLTGTVASEELQLAKLGTELAKLTTGAGQNALSIEKITESLAFGERQLAIYQEELAGLAEGSLEWDKKKLAIDKLTESMDMNQKQLEKLTASSDIDIISIQRKQQEIAKLTEEINKNKQAIQANENALSANRSELQKTVLRGRLSGATSEQKLAANLAEMELLKEFLAGEASTIRFSNAELNDPLLKGLGYMASREEAQIKYNKLLAEQTKRQQEILNIEKAQKQLDFLSNQINLIKMLSDRGLNPRDILGGIKLGIDASASDLLTATNRVVMAMVDQINKDLQIHSPSGLMIKTFKQVMAGAAIGMERGRSLLSDAVRSIPILNGSIPQPVFSQAGGISSSTSNVYNYNMPMTVNTTTSASGVMRAYEVKRSMYAN